MLARVEAHRELAEAVAKLDEPYREVVLSRFFEDLPPQEIAKRIGVPASTVCTRVEREVVQLRGRLEHRDLRGLVALVLMPRAGGRLATATAAKGAASTTTVSQGLLMTAWFQKVGIPAGIALLFVSFLTYHFVMRDGPPSDSAPPGVATSTSAAAAPPADATTEQRTAVPTSPGPAREVVAAVRYRILDASGQPLANVPLQFEQLPAGVHFTGRRDGATAIGPLVPAGLSDSAGNAHFEAPPGHKRMWAGPGFCTLATQAPTKSADGLLVAAPARLCHGEVVDANGMPLSGVALHFELPTLVDFPESLAAATRTAVAKSKSDAIGRFAIYAPVLRGTKLVASKRDYRPTYTSEFGEAMRIELHKAEHPYRLTGKVVEQTGSGAWGAVVVVGDARTMTGFFGGFSIETAKLSANAVVIAAKKSHRPTSSNELLARLREEHAVEGIELVLGGEPLSQEGIVVDTEGAPLADLVVCIWHPLTIADFTTPEDLARGQEGTLSNLDHGPARIDARTDATGRFRVTGLGQQSYRYRVFDPKTLASVTTEAIPAGSAMLRQTLDKSSRRTLRGIVTTRDGKPAARVRVQAGLNTWQTATFTARASGPYTKTDAYGRFKLREVVAGDTTIELAGAGLIGRRLALHEFPQGGELELQLASRCSFRVQLGAACQAERFELRDANDQPLLIRQARGAIVTEGSSWRLTDGQTDVLDVSEDAVAIVMLQDGAEIDRRALALRIGSIYNVR